MADYGKCPHCGRIQNLRGPKEDRRVAKHPYRPAGGPMQPECPGAGRKPVAGTER